MQNIDEKTILQYLNIGSTIVSVAGWAGVGALDLPGGFNCKDPNCVTD